MARRFSITAPDLMRPFVSDTLKKIAKKANVKIIVEPVYGVAGAIVAANGRRTYFKNSNFDLNPLGASEIARDKDWAYFFMRDLGYPVVASHKFYSKEWRQAIGAGPEWSIDAGYARAKSMGFPVIVKPNSKSQGLGVVKVHNRQEFYQAARFATIKDRVFLVQEVAMGKDYRIVVLDGEVISAYERIPLSVVGDGKTTIQGLLARKQKVFNQMGRDTTIDIEDFRIKMKLKRRGLNIKSVPRRGERLPLLDAANLSSGGEAVDVTPKISGGFKKLAITLTRDMGLRYAGVDLMTVDDIAAAPHDFRVIEINAAPGIDNYAASGGKQAKIVEEMYLKILRALAGDK